MRTNKRTTMLRTCTAAFALAVGMFTGFAENTLGLNGKYWWIDNVDGVNQPREANYLDRVTNENPRQMKALVASVLADQSVPGQLTMIGYDGTDKPVDYTIYRNSSNSYYISTSFFNNYNSFARILGDLNYEKKEEKVGFIFPTTYTWEEANVSPNKDGLTVILVEMVDDYNPSETTTDFNTCWEQIKAVSVIPTDRQYRTTGTDKYSNGYLINLNQKLNKFFLLIKGDIYDHSGGDAPFYTYFEAYRSFRVLKSL